MCNQYNLALVGGAMNNIAKGRLTEVEWDIGNAGPGKVFPKYTGVVVRSEKDRLIGNAMTWGFPRVMRGAKGQLLKPRPVNNTRCEKLATPFWKGAAVNPDQRCLIPVSAFAEATGISPNMTTTWLSLPDQPVFACAGIWRDSAEWGRCYSMVMCDARSDLHEIHDRMPVILAPDDYESWLSSPLEELTALCTPWNGQITIDYTDTKWGR